MSQKRTHVKVGDQALVLSGKDKGKKGEILEIFPEKGRAVVEGVNFITKHVRPDPQTQQGGAVSIDTDVWGLCKVPTGTVRSLCGDCLTHIYRKSTRAQKYDGRQWKWRG